MISIPFFVKRCNNKDIRIILILYAFNYMTSILYYKRCEINFELNNINLDKINKCINIVAKNIKLIKLINKSTNYSVLDKIIYFKINVISNKIIMNINFSHVYYDAYSIFTILEIIDNIYLDKISSYPELNIYKFDKSLTSIIYNNINLIKNFSIKSTIDYFYKRNKKAYKININKIKDLSNPEIIKFILKKLNINEYCLYVNARKIFPELNNKIGNLIYISNNIKINDNIRDILDKDKNYTIDILINKLGKSTLINSYLGFNLPSFVKKINANDLSFSNTIFIHPLTKDYLYFDYYY
jgi:hypothetical protein